MDNDHRMHGEHEHTSMIDDLKKRFWISLILTIPILILSPTIQELVGLGEATRFNGDMLLLFILSSLVYFYGGYPFFKGFYKQIKSGIPGMDTLITVAITSAYLYSSAVVFGLMGEVFFWELATLIDIMLIGHWLEMRSIMGASRALEELTKLMPSTAHKINKQRDVEDIPLEELTVGDQVLIKPGEKVPVDGEIIKGFSSIDESMLTGESQPVLKNKGGEVIGGSINGDGSLTVKITKTGEDSFLSQVISLVEEAQSTKSKTQNMADRFATVLTIIALTGGFVTFLAWYFFSNFGSEFALERAVTVMVITCPHALGLAVPLVVAVSTALSASNGLLIRNRTAFERSRNIDAVIFDKTGTLTEGRFGVTDVLSLSEEYQKEDILRYSAALEALSEHPVARGVVEAVRDNRYFEKDSFEVDEFKSIPGRGVQGVINGKKVEIVSPGYLRDNNINIKSDEVNNLIEEGKTVIFLLIDGDPIGSLALSDIIRAESRKAIKTLRDMNIQCIMITGDRQEVADWVAQEIELDKYYAEVLPQEKAEKVGEIQSKGLTVAMIGDGINDAPALAQADVGIAIGAGTDVAIEAGDVVLVRSNPLDVVYVVKLARSTYRKMLENLLWGTGYNVLAIPIAAGVLFSYGIILTPAVGAILMSASTIIVAFNSRILKIGK
jgi:Cu2+-exporting ATPase